MLMEGAEPRGGPRQLRWLQISIGSSCFSLWLCQAADRDLYFSFLHSVHIAGMRIGSLGTEMRAREGAQRGCSRCWDDNPVPSGTSSNLESWEQTGTQSSLLDFRSAHPRGSLEPRAASCSFSPPFPIPLGAVEKRDEEGWLRECWCIIEGFT